MDTYPARVALVVKEAIDSAGLTPTTLADAAAIPRTTFLRKLSGDDPEGFTTRHLSGIARVLGRKPSSIYRDAERVA